ncbi:MAG: carbohydrate ABC transporter permease [Clostridia bacterium]|nr:carbohydrate ABC transporter permease [Clostridia bacterium]
MSVFTGIADQAKNTAPKKAGMDSVLFRKKLVEKLIAFFRIFLIIGLSFVILYPVLYMLSVSFRASADVLDPAVVWIPRTFTLENYKMAAWLLDYQKSLVTSLLMAVLCAVLQCFTCSVTGYGFARFNFKGRTALLLGALATLLVPIQTTMMPLYNSFVQFTHHTGIPTIDTPIPMAVSALFGVGLKAGLFIFIFFQFYKGMPMELEDAAYIDGCGPIKAYFRIMIPNAGAMFLVVFLLSLVWYWNDDYASVLYYPSNAPLSVGLSNMANKILASAKPDGTAYTQADTMAYLKTGALLCVAPILAVYAVLQRRFTKSVITSGIVG